jgi:two-component system LytT family response regulator
MNLFIIEDEILAAERIKKLILQAAPDAQIVGMADSVEESIQFLRSQPMPDLILMDIELCDGQSFEIFQEVDITCPVIFTTAYDEYALQAFKAHRIDYLLKPIQQDELSNSIAKFRQLQQSRKISQTLNVDELIEELRSSSTPATLPHREHFLVRQGQRLVSVSLDDIAYFRRDDRTTMLCMYDGRCYPLDYTLAEVEQQIESPQFFRANPQFLVARRAIGNLSVQTDGKIAVTLKPSETDRLLVNRDVVPAFRKWLGR